MLDDPEQGWSVGILIPRQILINPSSLLGGVSVVVSELLRVGFAEVDEDGVAFAEFEVFVGDEGHFAEGVHVQVLLGLRLLAEQVHSCDGGLDTAQGDESSDCPGRLADDVPVEGERHAI